LLTPALAQTDAVSPTAAPSATQGLATITVTARKKKENLQRVPLSVTAISAKTLKRAHVENLHDVIALTPGVNIADAGAEAVTTVTIRGDTDQTFGVNIPDVAFFLDGAYLRDPTAINVAAIPLSDVEIVKGPVSALYGRDAYAGVIAYTAARPTTTPHADISETAGDFGKSELQGDISGPIYGDKVLGEIFGDFDTFNGTYKDKISGATGGSYTKKDFGGLLDFNWTDNFSTHLDFYYGYDHFGNPAVERVAPNCGSGIEINPDGSPNFAAHNLYCGQVKTNGSVQISNNPAAGLPGNVRRTFYTSMNNNATFNFGTIDAITGASQVDESAIQPFDANSLGQPYQLANAATPGTPNGNFVLEHGYYGSGSNTGNFSQELRYNSPSNLPYRVGAGGFFYDEARTDVGAAAITDANVPTGQVFYTGNFGSPAIFATPNGSVGQNVNSDKHETNEEAGFTNAEIDVLPNLTASTQYVDFH
jgi:iron complex outermembrane receptor protein